MTMAEEINAHLENNGTVIISTYLKNIQYNKKHSGLFFMGDDDELYVKEGRGTLCLSTNNGKMLLVKIRLFN